MTDDDWYDGELMGCCEVCEDWVVYWRDLAEDDPRYPEEEGGGSDERVWHRGCR